MFVVYLADIYHSNIHHIHWNYLPLLSNVLLDNLYIPIVPFLLNIFPLNNLNIVFFHSLLNTSPLHIPCKKSFLFGRCTIQWYKTCNLWIVSHFDFFQLDNLHIVLWLKVVFFQYCNPNNVCYQFYQFLENICRHRTRCMMIQSVIWLLFHMWKLDIQYKQHCLALFDRCRYLERN